MSTELMRKVDEILLKAEIPDRHSYFQIEKFVIGKEPTAQAQLWACVREIEARRETVANYERDLADAEDNLAILEVKADRLNLQIDALRLQNTAEASLDIREAQAVWRKLDRERVALAAAAEKAAKKLRCVAEEMAFLVAGYEQIVEKVGPMRPMDDDEAQREMWAERALEEFNLRVILQRPLDPEFVKHVLCLHDEAPVKKHVVAMITGIQTKMLADRKAAERRVPQIDIKPNTTGR